MKKLSFILALIMLVGLFASCEGIGDDPPAPVTEDHLHTSAETETTVLTDAPDETEAVLDTQPLVAYEKTAEKFSFSFTVDKTEYHPGEEIYLYAKVTNVSGEDHVYIGSYSAFMAGIILYWQTESGEIGEKLVHDPIPMTEDIGTHTIKNGDSRTTTYIFRLPDDVKCTSYTVFLGYNSESVVFEDVINITASETAN